jgi:hypothetical protein
VILADALVTAATDGPEATGGHVLPPTAEPLRGAPVAGTKAAEEAEEAIAEASDDPGADETPETLAAEEGS